jgi:hypothetical protein
MKALGWTMVVLLVLVATVGLFNWWTEAQHDKSAYEYVQDEWGWFGGSDADAKEVVIEDEASSVTIRF